jgi:hypothetical protein
VGVGFLICCRLMSVSHRGSFLVRSYFNFSMMISVGLSSHVELNYHLYADDIKVYAGGRSCDIFNCIYRLNVDLEAMFRWSVEKGLSPNSGTTQAMIICRDRGRLPALLPVVLVDGRTVPYSTSVKNLGLTMDNRFSWRYTRLIVLGGMLVFRIELDSGQFDDVTPIMTRKKLVQSPVIPHFLYCDVIFACFGGGQ